MIEAPDIVAINLDARFVMFGDNTTGPIVDMFDASGDETSDPEEAFSIIVNHDAHGRFYMELPDEFVAGVIQ